MIRNLTIMNVLTDPYIIKASQGITVFWNISENSWKCARIGNSMAVKDTILGFI